VDSRHITVLLIEDNPGDVALIRTMLSGTRGLPVSLQCADRLSTGLERLAQGGIDLVVLDLNLPDSTGLATISHVHARAPHVPVIVLTGAEDEVLGANAVWAGAQDYLVKGQVDGSLLLRAIRYAISRHGLQMAAHQRALMDDFTGLYNETAFLSLAARDLALASRRGEHVLLAVARVEGFGSFVDAFGAREGERALAEVASAVRQAFRETDLVARLGGKEFGALASSPESEELDALLARLRENLRNVRPRVLTLRLGAARGAPSALHTAQALLAQARAPIAEEPISSV